MVKIGNFFYQKSTRPGKKLMVKYNNRTIHFGSSKNKQFKDKTGYWKSLDHGDTKKRKSYLSRSAGIKNKEGKLTKDNPDSANFHARRILW